MDAFPDDQGQDRMNKKIVLTALVLLSACSGKSTESPADQADQPPIVSVAPIALRTISRDVTASGVLVAREEAGVGAELSGYRVLRVLAEEGDVVHRGQALAVLDPALIDEQVAQAEVATEKATAENARVADLKGRGVIADEVIEQRGFEARTAVARLRDLRQRQSRLVLRAPVTGRVLSRSLRPGDVSGAGSEPYFRIARDGIVELEAEVPEADFGRMRVGASVPVQLSSGEQFTGVIRLISPMVDSQTKLGKVRILLPVDPSQRVGGFARASIITGRVPSPAVPDRAIQYRAGGPSLTVVGLDNRVRRVQVRLGERGGGYVQLLDGPPVGTRALVGGEALVLPGDVVRTVLDTPQ
jgi:HlyD family secretion protein